MLLSVFSLIFIFACGEKQSEEKPSTETEQVTPQKEGVEYPRLSPEASNIISSWQYFQEFENDLKNINRGNLRNYKSETERMVTVADSLLKNIPDPLNTPAISSRMRVVNVRVKLLNETLQQPNSEASKILSNLEETNTAFTNLLIQINGKFEKESIDIEASTDENLERGQIEQDNDSL